MDKKEIGYSHLVCLSIGIFHNILQKDIKNIFALVPPILLKLYIKFFFCVNVCVPNLLITVIEQIPKAYECTEVMRILIMWKWRHSLVNYSNWYLVPHRQWIQYNHLFIYYLEPTCSFSTKEVMIMLPQVSEVSTPDLSNSI